MTTADIIDGIIRRVNETNMSHQQLADASNVPKATVDRILRGDTQNPTMQTVLDLAAAVGYTFSNHPDQLPAVPETPKFHDPTVQYIINFYERQGIVYEERIKRVMATYNMQLAEKNRTIRNLCIIIGLLIAGFISLLLIDMATPEIGWFPHDANSITIGLAIVGVSALAIGAMLLHKKSKE